MTRIHSAIRTVRFSLATTSVLCLSLATPALAQDPAEVQRWFESGRFQQVTESASPAAPPQVRFLAGQSFQKQNATGQAVEAYQSLAALPESDAWHFVGRSAELLVQNQTDEALANANRAVEVNGGLTEAHYQLGLVHARRQEWPAAAQAFDRAAQLDPGYAYAYYYGGLSHYRAGRPDRMATQFELFLRAAPEAPERPEVLGLMRSVRGR
jgi:tetratricopeptide (TPR) repeat protein